MLNHLKLLFNRHFRSRKLVVVDPSLHRLKGHHVSLACRIAEIANNTGVKCIFIAHQNFPMGELDEVASVHREFMFDKYDIEKRSNKTSDNDKILEYFLAPNGYGAAIEKVLEIEDVKSVDSILFHTSDNIEFTFLSRFIDKTPMAAIPNIHLSTPYNYKTFPRKTNGIPNEEIIRQLKSMGLVNKKVFLYGEVEFVKDDLSKKWNLPVRTLTLPPPIGARHTLSEARTPKAPLKIVCLGAAREEKGFLILLNVLEGLSQTPGADDAFEFFIQTSPPAVGYAPEVKEAVERIENKNYRFVSTHPTSLSEDEFSSRLMDSDIVLMPYSPRNYQTRGSGIANDAVAYGKIIVVTERTALRKFITCGGGMTATTAQEFVDALWSIHDNINNFHHAALEQAKRYHQLHGARNYVDLLVHPTSTKSL